ncbi:hypothetical protein Taro_030649 [Colocasia esculenta]|uniref:DUF8040 domain-containing protein n=1 Tax=Colocasia esculenta TaxID=4460 RepID=A0A843VUL1_COLES|nr:hypothetical protein [Colocasia esculenta]
MLPMASAWHRGSRDGSRKLQEECEDVEQKIGLPTLVFFPRSPYLALGFTPLQIVLSIDNASCVYDAMTVFNPLVFSLKERSLPFLNDIIQLSSEWELDLLPCLAQQPSLQGFPLIPLSFLLKGWLVASGDGDRSGKPPLAAKRLLLEVVDLLWASVDTTTPFLQHSAFALKHCVDTNLHALMREAILEENAMFLAIGEILMSSTIDEDEEDTTPIPRPMHTSRHSEHVWVHEVLHGHERRCYNTFQMHPSMFLKLRDILVERELIRDSRYVTTSEQLAMFLYAMGHGIATGAMCEHFQHSSETISYYVNHVIKAIALPRFIYIVLPSGTHPVHPRIRHDDRFYPYFKDAIGAINGTYITAHLLKDRQACYRNRKNVISQNVMGVCGFDLILHYVGVGFEGAAADMTVLRQAIDVGGFTVPQGKYYFVDSGYGNVGHFLAPYRVLWDDEKDFLLIYLIGEEYNLHKVMGGTLKSDGWEMVQYLFNEEFRLPAAEAAVAAIALRSCCCFVVVATAASSVAIFVAPVVAIVSTSLSASFFLLMDMNAQEQLVSAMELLHQDVELYAQA